MATYNSTTFGAISGRHGSAVAAYTKTGKCILKVFKAPSNPNTDKQVAQRTKFGFVNSELSCMRELFKITFGSNLGKNQAVSLALKDAISGVAPDFALDYSKLKISGGSLYGSGSVSVTKTADTTLKIDWNFSDLTGNTANDGVNLAFFNVDSKEALLKQNIALRSICTVDIELPAIWVGQNIHCWIYFSSPDGMLNSNSRYIDLVQL
jgi:hypothetical protein